MMGWNGEQTRSMVAALRVWTVLLASASCAAPAAQRDKRMTVKELQEFAAAEQAARKADSAVAEKLTEVELSEELTDRALDRMRTKLKPGEKTAEALKLLRDLSAFQPLPAEELPARDAPTVEERRRMLEGAVHFAGDSLRHLPDFLAERVTRSYDNAPWTLDHGSFVVHWYLHWTGTHSQEVAYRDGHETAIGSGGKDAQGAGQRGLSSVGEFGPTLAILLRGASKGTVRWSHWEEMAAGMAGVFDYEVPAKDSEYLVDYCCVKPGAARPVEGVENSYHGTPGFHGRLYIDAATGAVVRYTLWSEMQSTDPILRSSVTVDYGPVKIGESTYMCPVRSAAITETLRMVTKRRDPLRVLSVNETSFEEYHRFGTTSRILPGDAP